MQPEEMEELHRAGCGRARVPSSMAWWTSSGASTSPSMLPHVWLGCPPGGARPQWNCQNRRPPPPSSSPREGLPPGRLRLLRPSLGWQAPSRVRAATALLPMTGEPLAVCDISSEFYGDNLWNEP